MDIRDIMERDGEKREGNLVILLFVFVIVLVSVVFWHPWLNDNSAEGAFEKYYGSRVDKLYEIKLIKWQPFGHEFEVRSNTDDALVGYGLINIWMDVVEFKYVWENR